MKLSPQEANNLARTKLRDEWYEDLAVIQFHLNHATSFREVKALMKLKGLLNYWLKVVK